MNRTIAVLGGGAGAYMLAADLKKKGHRIHMYIRPGAKERNQELFQTKTIEVTGAETFTSVIDVVTDDMEEAVGSADYIMIAAPAFMRTTYAKALKGCIRKDQLLLLYPGSFGSLVFKKMLGEAAPNVIVDGDTLPYNVRKTGPCLLNLANRNHPNLAFFPASEGDKLFDTLVEELHPYNHIYEDVMECGLCNVNPALHLGICLLNMGQVERDDVVFRIFADGLTPTSAKLSRALDYERKAIARCFGFEVSPTEDFIGIPAGYTWQQFYDVIKASDFVDVEGPNGIGNRYFTDDIPHGLVVWQSLAGITGVATPITDALILIFNTIYERDWTKTGTTTEDMGIAGMNLEQIREYVRTGKRS